MPANFDWQTDDDRRPDSSLWDDTSPAGDRPPSSAPSRGRLITAAAMLLLLLLVGGFAWRQADRRAEANLQAIREDVAASDNVVRQAAARTDEELLRTVLSGRDPIWTNGQLELFQAGLTIDRAAFDLGLVEGALDVADSLTGSGTSADDATAPNTSVSLSPDLTEAVVSRTWPYAAASGDVVYLQQTSVFRRGSSNWLLSPPLESFWGPNTYETVGRLNITFPTRDADLIRRLAADLDQSVEAACRLLEDIRCVAEQPVPLLFVTDPAVLQQFADLLGAVQRQEQPPQQITLPTPTLVGLPVMGDAAQAEAGYQELLRLYESRILAAVVARSTGWECCQQSSLFEALLRAQLHELGIIAAPATAADRQLVLDDRIRLSDIAPLWRTNRPNTGFWDERRLADLAVDFLLQAAPGSSAAALQRSLTGASDFNSWVNNHLIGTSNDLAWVAGSLEQAWWMYALQGTLPAAASPAPLPGESLYLTCTPIENGDVREPSRLLRYGTQSAGAQDNDWQEIHSLEGFIWMSSLPDPDTLLLQELVIGTDTWQTSVWRDGYLTLHGQKDAYYISLGETDPSGAQLVAYAVDTVTGDVNPQLLQIGGCDGDCAVRPLPGYPAWSPDGSQVLYSMTDNAVPTVIRPNGRVVLLDAASDMPAWPLSLGSGDATGAEQLQPVAEGYAPFWIDDDTFGYITPGADPSTPNQYLVLQEVEGGSTQTVIRTDALVALLPGSEFRRDSYMAYAMAHPTNPQLLFITLIDRISSQSFVFAHDLGTNETSLRLRARADMNHSLSVSPDGRFLVLTGRDRATNMPEDSSALLLLHDIAANRTTPFVTRLPFFLPAVSYDWTGDSSRLAIVMDDGLIGIVSPDAGAVDVLPHPHGACTSLAWMER